MKVLITGGGGQLGQALQSASPAGADIVVLDREALDIADRAMVLRTIETARPDVVINAAAYTAVDRAEHDGAAAQRVNVTAVSHLADAAHVSGAAFVHVSSDFVFDGFASMPYLPGAPTNPISVYGRTKRDGEVAALAHPQALVVRTAWLYSAGGRNFLTTMLKLMPDRDVVRVVADQIGTPTHTRTLAQSLWTLVSKQ